MFKKALLALVLLVSATGAYAQTAGQAVTGFLLAQGSTYGSFTCPASFTSPCFVQYGSTVPISGSITANLSGFTPTAGATAALSATGTSADVALPAGTDVVVSSPSTNTVPVFIRLQAGAGTAVTSDLPVNPGAAVGFHITTQTHISGITGGTAASLQIQGGAGLATGYGGGGSGSGGAVTNAGTFAVQLTGATNNVNNISGTVSLPTGAATAANQTTANTSLATIATNSGSSIPAGAAIIGQTGIDQTTDGTTNAVHLKAGTAIAGKFGIDQTTPGTTNNVTLSTNVGTLPIVQATASVPITFTAAGGPTQIIAASGSTKIYVTHIHYVLSGAGTFALVTGTGTNCGTGTTYLEGASGHPLSYAANGGISAGSGLGPIYVTGAGGEICAITTGAVDTSGTISYAQF